MLTFEFYEAFLGAEGERRENEKERDMEIWMSMGKVERRRLCVRVLERWSVLLFVLRN